MTNLRIVRSKQSLLLRNKEFESHFKKRIKKNSKLVFEFKNAIELFLNNPNSSILNDHDLRGRMYRFRSFSVNDDIRVIYIRNGNTIRLIDIGTHDEVYYE